MLGKKIKTLNRHIRDELSKDKWHGKRTRLNYLKVAVDFTICLKKYNLVPEEYLYLDFYDLDSDRRTKIISRRERDEYVKLFNDKKDLSRLENKVEFLKQFKAYINRDFLILSETSTEEFRKFHESNPEFIAKQSDSGQGKGVKLIKDENDSEKLYEFLTSNNFDLVEQKVTTHDKIRTISPQGLPPIRVFTFIDNKGEAHIVFSATNLSLGNPIVNFSSGGVKALINPETGKIVTHAINKKNEKVKVHPVTGSQFKGFQIPEWDQLKSMILKAAKEVPTVRFVGWDCAISDNGPLIIEANANRPGINGQQMPAFDKADERYAKLDFVRSEYQKLIGTNN